MNFGIALLVRKIGGLIFTKKRIGGLIAAVALAAAAAMSGLSIEEIKSFVADAPVIEPLQVNQ